MKGLDDRFPAIYGFFQEQSHALEGIKLMQTAFSITDVSFSANHVFPGTVSLNVTYRIHNDGPSHVSGLIVTTDFWASSQVVTAKFQGFGAGFEFWKATFQTGSEGPFEFVIFCDDFGGVNNVPRIWNTNNGNRFSAKP